MSSRPLCFLFDNGSLRPAATLSLRRVAAVLSETLGFGVRPVSLLHSSAIAPDALEGRPAELLEPALRRALEEGVRSVVLLPLFFGPSAALTEYVPGRLDALLRGYPGFEVRLAQCLVNPGDRNEDRVAQALAGQVRQCWKGRGWSRTQVVLVDHGSPQRAVAAVRDALTAQVRQILGEAAEGVYAASMERRAGEEYAFSRPLLEERLRQPPCDGGPVVVLLQFLSAGRHAGPEGDVAAICAAAEAERPGLSTAMTEPLAEDPRVIAVLADRFAQALQSPPFVLS